MPIYKYIANRLLTAVENLLLGAKLSEYHTGYRAYAREVLETLPLNENSDDFVFDNELLAQAIAFGFRIGEISCPTHYSPEASSINFQRSVVYGFGVLGTAAQVSSPPVGGSLVFACSERTGRLLDGVLPPAAVAMTDSLAVARSRVVIPRAKSRQSPGDWTRRPWSERPARRSGSNP